MPTYSFHNALRETTIRITIIVRTILEFNSWVTKMRSGRITLTHVDIGLAKCLNTGTDIMVIFTTSIANTEEVDIASSH